MDALQAVSERRLFFIEEVTMSEQTLEQILHLSSQRHSHLCPRQVLGARIGLAGAAALGLD